MAPKATDARCRFPAPGQCITFPNFCRMKEQRAPAGRPLPVAVLRLRGRRAHAGGHVEDGATLSGRDPWWRSVRPSRCRPRSAPTGTTGWSRSLPTELPLLTRHWYFTMMPRCTVQVVVNHSVVVPLPFFFSTQAGLSPSVSVMFCVASAVAALLLTHHRLDVVGARVGQDDEVAMPPATSPPTCSLFTKNVVPPRGRPRRCWSPWPVRPPVPAAG